MTGIAFHGVTIMKPFEIAFLAAASLAFADQSLGDGDAANGEKLFNGFLKCGGCHSLEPNVTKVGPSLAGIFGQRAGTVEGFDRYSEAMIDSGVIWNEESLDAFLKAPKKFIPGNSMLMASYYDFEVGSAQHRADVIAYLKTHSNQ